MIMHNPAWSCENFKKYYYDFIDDDMRSDIPEDAVSHITECDICQNNVDRLRCALQKQPFSAEKNHIANITQTLELHFSCIDKPVTCTTVKPFLPSLADSEFEVKVPTPITAHIDSCENCAKDVEIIRSLNLTHKQLCLLSQLLAEDQSACDLSIPEKDKAIELLANFEFSEVDSEITNHILSCDSCRNALRDARDVKFEYSTGSPKASDLPCENAESTDFFDYAIPYGIEFKSDQYIRFRQTFLNHLKSCSVCQQKILRIHEKISTIIERPDSGIYTVFTLQDSSESVNRNTNRYGEYGINVQVISSSGPEGRNRLEQNTQTVQSRNRTFKLHYTSLVKPATAAAAVFLIAFLLWFHTPQAVASELSDIYNFLASVKNIHIQRFVPGSSKPVQEHWVSTELNLTFSKNQNGQTALWDFTNNILKARCYGELTIHQLSSDQAKAGLMIYYEIGFLPFRRISDLPAGARWQQIDDVTPFNENSELYELSWPQSEINGIVRRKIWRVFLIDHRPTKLEWYIEFDNNNKDRKLETLILIDYPKTEQVKSVVNAFNFNP